MMSDQKIPNRKHIPMEENQGWISSKNKDPSSCTNGDTIPTGNETKNNPPWYRDRYLLPVIVTVYIIDQITKWVVRNNLDMYESWPTDGPLRITRSFNTGTAFGFLLDQTTFLIIASILAIALLCFFYWTQVNSSPWLRLSISLQLGGALGNLNDRILAGAVTDFIDVGPWPIFNVADSSIVIGITVLLVKTIFPSIGNREPPSSNPQVKSPHE